MGIKKACLSKCANTYYTSFHWSRATMRFSFLTNRKIISQNGSPCQKKFVLKTSWGNMKLQEN